jgi:hypothetical protein
MTDDECVALVRAAIPPTGDEHPARDLWSSVRAGAHTPPRWSWLDLAVAAAAAVALAMNPQWLSLLAYHL